MTEAAQSLIYNLRSLAKYEHADLSIAGEAADRIEHLEAALRDIEECAMSGSLFEELARKGLADQKAK